MASIFFFFFFTHLIFLFPQTSNSKTIPQFKTILIFGDSTVDTGNNNYIQTVLKANHKPYGINFPGENATGRFSDGKLPSDLVASSLGIKDFVPPFLDPNLSNDDLRTGVSFASAGSGYDDLTSRETSAIPQLQSKLPGSKILYADLYTTMYNMTINPHAYGNIFQFNTHRGCCGTGLLEVGPICSILSPMCPNASQYLYFDSVHPTEAAYRFLSKALETQILRKL